MNGKRLRHSRVAATLKEWRRKTEHTQADIAGIVGCSLNAVRSWEQGLRVPGETIDREKLAAAYWVELVEVHELLGD